MIKLLSDARLEVMRFVDNGSCDMTRVDAVINDAVERLMTLATDLGHTSLLYRTMRFGICNTIVALPYNVESIIAATIDGSPVQLHGPMYQFLSSGPGDLEYEELAAAARYRPVDLGDGHPTMFEVPYVDVELPVAAFSTSMEDAGKSLQVRGFGTLNMDVRTGSDAGVAVPIQVWEDGVEGQLRGKWGSAALPLSSQSFREITRVVKPATTGYVSLFSVGTDGTMTFLAKYHPSELVPSFRRYKIAGQTAGNYANLLALVKMRHVPLVQADDVIPVQPLAAVKLMVQSISREDAGDLGGAEAYKAAAWRLMSERARSREKASGTPVVIDVDRGLAGRSRVRPL